MRKLVWTAAVAVMMTALVVLLAGCRPPQVGEACADDGDCDRDLACRAFVEGGYCTEPCTTTGSTDECPDGAVCDTIGTEILCLQICEVTEDCPGGIDCNGVSGSNLRACRPTP